MPDTAMMSRRPARHSPKTSHQQRLWAASCFKARSRLLVEKTYRTVSAAISIRVRGIRFFVIAVLLYRTGVIPE